MDLFNKIMPSKEQKKIKILPIHQTVENVGRRGRRNEKGREGRRERRGREKLKSTKVFWQ